MGFFNSILAQSGEYYSGKVRVILHDSTLLSETGEGSNDQINQGETATHEAQNIGEDAYYNWYNNDGKRVHEGINFVDTPQVSVQYTLEVISKTSGLKDYDQKTVQVKQHWISSLSPNPAQNRVVVTYHLQDNPTNPHLVITNTSATINQQYPINNQQNNIAINTSSLPTGSYTVSLVCNGQTMDTKTLIIN